MVTTGQYEEEVPNTPNSAVISNILTNPCQYNKLETKPSFIGRYPHQYKNPTVTEIKSTNTHGRNDLSGFTQVS